MANYIDKDKLLDVANRLIVPEAFEAMKNIANSIPVADVVEIIHCKDCKHYKHNKYYQTYCCCRKPKKFIDKYDKRKLDDYCSYGERKGEDNG